MENKTSNSYSQNVGGKTKMKQIQKQKIKSAMGLTIIDANKLNYRI